jgi:hypothetical protein
MVSVVLVVGASVDGGILAAVATAAASSAFLISQIERVSNVL